MNHAMLEVNFSPNINFIVGKNGSGKSAILAGIMLGLGGNASVGGRGNSAAEYIKKGEQQALISVTIYNQGVEAFQPEVYGDYITIERAITAKGS